MIVSKRLRPGAVLQLTTPKGIAHLQYVGRHTEYGDAVVVNPNTLSHPITVTDQIFVGAYLIFYPAAAAVAQGLLEVVGHLKPPTLPHRFRRPGARLEGRITSWIIEDGETELIKSKLSNEDITLPIAAIWNHELLVQRIIEGWSPSRDGV